MVAVCHKFVVSDSLSAYSQPKSFLLAGCNSTWNSQNSIALSLITFYKRQMKETKAGKNVFEVIDNFGGVCNSVPARQRQKHK